MDEFEKEYEQFASWTRNLLATIDDCLPQIRKALDPSSELPENCPSHASMAELIFRQVRKKFDEVAYCVEQVEKAIGKLGAE